MGIEELKTNWNKLGKIDPLWAILTHPDKTNRRWEKANFFRTGRTCMSQIMKGVYSLKLNLSRGKALDFGCGVGRLTQSLCQYFEECVGIDIADSMIQLAQEYNQHGARCKYYVNESDNLNLFENNTFDFILSLLVLQHIKPEISLNYIKEFLRIITPGGLIIFQLPSEPKQPPKHREYFNAFKKLNTLFKTPDKRTEPSDNTDLTTLMGMHGISKEVIVNTIENNGGKIVKIQRDHTAGPSWLSFRYYITKQEN